MSGLITSIIQEEILLLENVQQAEKILTSKGIDPSDDGYQEFKKELLKDNRIGFLGLLTKLSIQNQPVTKPDGTREDRWHFIYNIAKSLYNEIIENKNLLNSLPQELQKYDNPNELMRDLRNLKQLQMSRKLANKLTKKELVTQLKNYVPSNEEVEDIKYLLGIKSEDRKEFLIKTDKYENAEDLFRGLAEFVEDHKTGFNYSIVLNKIKNMSDDQIKVVYTNEEKQMILALIYKYSAAREIGSKSWCIVGDEEQFNNYTRYGKNYQYFFFNFNPQIPANEKMIAFTMDAEGDVTASHDRYDGEFLNPTEYLQKLGILRKFIEINSRERAEAHLLKYGAKENIPDYADEYSFTPVKLVQKDEEGREHTVEYRIRPITLDLLRVLRNKDFKSKYHLDLIVKKFENYPIFVKVKNEPYYDKSKRIEKVNAFEFIIPDIENLIKKTTTHNAPIELTDYSDYSEYGEEPKRDLISPQDAKQKMIDFSMKIYQSQIQLKSATKVQILHFLKDNKTDVLKFVQQIKAKTGDDLTGSEFGMLAKRGEDLRPVIQNKLAALRRGEDVNITQPEIKYAIENGYRDVIMKYYRDALPYYYENQLDYENMQIYQQLGLMPEIEKVIVTKGDTYGLDTLNSIERSIYDMARRKNS